MFTPGNGKEDTKVSESQETVKRHSKTFKIRPDFFLSVLTLMFIQPLACKLLRNIYTGVQINVRYRAAQDFITKCIYWHWKS